MASTAFTNGVTLTDADWFNDVNRLHYTIFSDPADAAAVVAALRATQAQQETGSSTSVVVTPGVQHFHPSALKAGVRFNSAGTIAHNYNITSIADNGVGDWTVVVATDFSAAGLYAAAGIIGYTNPGSNRGLIMNIATDSAAGTFRILTFDGIDGITLRDPNGVDEVHVLFAGDQ